MVLHTNDMHSHIDPFPENDPKNPGKGGMSRRAAYIEKTRKENDHVLLLDAGDVFQGTPYFNLYGGELEFKLMSQMKYDAATMGNHDFDNGLEGFLKMLPHAGFPFICSNYDFSQTILKDKTIPHKIIEKGGLKIGVFGLGIELKGLVSDKNFGNTIYHDPVKVANETASRLKNENDCDLVICLSHLGYKYENDKISDLKLAAQTKNIDLIIGGHTHTFLKEATIVNNIENKSVLINQAGWAGLQVGRIELIFEKNSGKGRNIGKITYIAGRNWDLA